MYRSKETDSKICQSLHHLSSSEDTFAKAKNNFPDFTLLSSNCNDVTLSFYCIYICIWHHMAFHCTTNNNQNVCSNNILQISNFNILWTEFPPNNAFRGYGGSYSPRIQWGWTSSIPGKRCQAAVENSPGEQKNNTTVTYIHIIPSKGYST